MKTAQQRRDRATYLRQMAAEVRNFTQDRSVADRPAHNREAAGSTPAPAPIRPADWLWLFATFFWLGLTYNVGAASLKRDAEELA